MTRTTDALSKEVFKKVQVKNSIFYERTFGKRSRQAKAIVEKHLAEFLKLTGIEKNDKAVEGTRLASIGVYFGLQEELAKSARKLDRQITLERGYTYWTWWNGDKTLNRVVAMVAADKLIDLALEDRSTPWPVPHKYGTPKSAG